MFAPFKIGVPRFSFWSSSNARTIDLPSVEIHDVEIAADKRPRTLKHLIKANHANHSIIYSHLRFHNHCPHILGSAYLLGSTPEHLNAIYDEEAKTLEPWRDSPGEISKEDWRDFLGKREYQRAFVDFFEDQLVQLGYDWKGLLQEYLFQGENPLINNVISGLGHPLIHLGYGYELASHTIAIEALALTACFYNFMHKYLDDPSYSKPSTYSTTSPLEILQKVKADTRFDGLFDERGADNIGPLFEKREAEVLEHWNAWQISDPTKQFEQSQEAAVGLLMATQQLGQKYDFFKVHLLTTSHAVRILLPLIPAKFQVSLVRQWWLFTLVVYIAQLRPIVEMEKITEYDLKGREWKFVVDRSLNSEFSLDAHYVKANRAIKEAAKTWGDDSQFYLKAAVKFADEFDHWGGFGDERAENVEHIP